jgi:hypothetical protein
VVFENAAELGNRFVQKTVLFVHQSVEPGNGPRWCGCLELERALERFDGVVQPAFLEINAGQIQRTIGAPKFFDLFKGLSRLDQLAFLTAFVAFEKQADTIVIPPLPRNNLRRLGGGLLGDAFDGR